jgi:hypothetical protein
VAALIHAAVQGAPVQGMTGPDRAMLYRVALGTGLRAGELRSLTPEAFDLDTDPPTVTVAASYSKRRRNDTQPIPESLADGLRPWLAGRPARRPVFPTMPRVKTAAMLRADLTAAGIPYRDGSGRVADFHALRATYNTAVVRGGASVKTAQALSRHSSPVLTIGRYAKAALHDKTAALAALPDLSRATPGPEAAALAPTGTDGSARAAHRQRACDGDRRNQSDDDGTPDGPDGAQEEPRGGLVRLGAAAVAEAPAGFEPANNGFANRCLTTWLRRPLS